jgi:hypothetical protein
MQVRGGGQWSAAPSARTRLPFLHETQTRSGIRQIRGSPRPRAGRCEPSTQVNWPREVALRGPGPSANRGPMRCRSRGGMASRWAVRPPGAGPLRAAATRCREAASRSCAPRAGAEGERRSDEVPTDMGDGEQMGRASPRRWSAQGRGDVSPGGRGEGRPAIASIARPAAGTPCSAAGTAISDRKDAAEPGALLEQPAGRLVVGFQHRQGRIDERSCLVETSLSGERAAQSALGARRRIVAGG